MGTFDTKNFPYSNPRKVCVPSFHLDLWEISVGEYRACVKAGACEGGTFDKYPKCNWGFNDETLPMNCVKWSQADAYCKWIGKRLPTEAEWEYTAKGGDKNYKYTWVSGKPSCKVTVMDEDITRVRSGCGRGGAWPTKRGSLGPLDTTQYGVRDMGGNLAEWVNDWWHESYDPNDVNNPQGPAKPAPETGPAKVMRGGSYLDVERSLEFFTYYRIRESMIYSDPNLGFRCAKDIKPLKPKSRNRPKRNP